MEFIDLSEIPLRRMSDRNRVFEPEEGFVDQGATLCPTCRCCELLPALCPDIFGRPKEVLVCRCGCTRSKRHG
jgi:hypothetical protein